jgi:hypothetical protein
MKQAMVVLYILFLSFFTQAKDWENVFRDYNYSLKDTAKNDSVGKNNDSVKIIHNVTQKDSAIKSGVIDTHNVQRKMIKTSVVDTHHVSPKNEVLQTAYVVTSSALYSHNPDAVIPSSDNIVLENPKYRVIVVIFPTKIIDSLSQSTLGCLVKRFRAWGYTGFVEQEMADMLVNGPREANDSTIFVIIRRNKNGLTYQFHFPYEIYSVVDKINFGGIETSLKTVRDKRKKQLYP